MLVAATIRPVGITRIAEGHRCCKRANSYSGGVGGTRKMSLSNVILGYPT